jgi:hypothetical protein
MQLYITCRSGHHHPTNPEQKQTHSTQHTTSLNHLGEKIKTSLQHLRRRYQRGVMQKTQPAAGPNNPS